jgi:hypothetical protein
MKYLLRLCLAAALPASPAAADPAKIYMGVTPVELADFLAGAGWTADRPVALQHRWLQMRHPVGGALSIVLLDCDRENRCAAGFLQSVTYMTVARQYAWHWNHHNQGAVAFGASYYSLKRPLHFRGVTETYLREVILELWPKVQKAFATDGEKAHNDYWKSRELPER